MARSCLEGLAWAGVQCGGYAPPRPPQVATLRCWSSGLLLTGLCAAVSPAGPVLPHRPPAVLLGRLAGVLLSRPSPGSPGGGPLLRRFSFPGKSPRCNPGGTTSRAGLAALGAPEGAPLTLSSPPGLATQRQEKKNTNAAATGPYGPGDAEHNVSSRQPQDRWRGRTGQPPQVLRCSTQPSEKNL